jgi:intracellular sulfur oxidation DsrE/DsrF family protein
MKRIFTLVLLLAAGPTVAHATQAPDPMTAPPPPGYYVFQKVLYQNDGGQPDNAAYFKGLMRNIANHLTAVDGKAEIRVVSFAAGVKLFQMAKTDPTVAAGLDGLRAKNVRFLVCRNTLRGMGVRPEDLYHVSWADVVPSGVAEIARLQGQGFVFEHP